MTADPMNAAEAATALPRSSTLTAETVLVNSEAEGVVASFGGKHCASKPTAPSSPWLLLQP